MSEFYVASDIGGTFTDTVVTDRTGRVERYKASTTLEEPVRGILDTLQLAANKHSLDLEIFLHQVRLFSHATTIATNTLLERRGAKTGLIQTAGFGDTLFFMRGNKVVGLDEAEMKDYRHLSKPQPVVERRMVREVVERVDYRGRILTPLDEEQARQIVRDLLAAGIESIAVSLLWSFKYPRHEQRIGEIIREEAPHLYMTLSSDILARMNEYARTQTASLNSYLGPTVRTTMESLDGVLRQQGLPHTPLLMRSNGGVINTRHAAQEAVATLLSGAVGGVVGACVIGKQVDARNVISTDMGGTSFDVGLIVDGKPLLQTEMVIDRQTVALPSVAVSTIGAGGGSIANVQSGLLTVGPRSAGAVPGPACYGLGGTEPTVTDADVVLGIINPDNFLGGRIKLDRERAVQAIRTKVAEPLGLSVEAAAAGIKRIIDSRMADLVRQATVYRGYDPRDFVLVAFGGAGPTHVHSYGADLGVPRIVVPVTASVLSAHGVLASDLLITQELSQSLITPPRTDRFSEHIVASDINKIFDSLETDSRIQMTKQEVASEQITITRYVDMRFRPQIFDLTIDVSTFPFMAPDVDALVDRFVRTYEARFGTGSSFQFTGVEITTFRVVASARLPLPTLTSLPLGRNGATPKGSTRKIFDNGVWIDATILDEHAIKPDATIDGPAVVELMDTTLVITQGQKATIDQCLNVIIDL